MAFSVYHAYNTPKLSIGEIEVKDIGSGLTQVTAIVNNERMIPTHSSQDVKNNIEIPDIVTLTGGTVVAGMVVTNRDMNFTVEQNLDPVNIKVNNIPGNSFVTVRWLVKGGSKFTVNVASVKGGFASKSN
jgi:hypothetical protein